MNPLDKENALAPSSSASALAAKSQTVQDRRKMLEEWRKKKQESQNKSSAPKQNNTSTVLPKKDFANVKKPSASKCPESKPVLKASRVQTTKPTVNAVKSFATNSSLNTKPKLSNNNTKSVPVGSRPKVTTTATDSSNSRPASSVAKKPAVPSLQRKASTMSLRKPTESTLDISAAKSSVPAQVLKAQSRVVAKKSTEVPVKSRVERKPAPQKLEMKARQFLQKSMENSLIEKSTTVQMKEPCDVQVTAETKSLTANVDDVGMTPLAEPVIETKSPGLVNDAAIASFEEAVERQIDEIEKSLGSVVLCDPNINDTVMNEECQNLAEQLNESLSIDPPVSTSLSINDSVHPEEPEMIIIDNNNSVASPPRADVAKTDVSRLNFSTPKTAKLHLKSKFSESAKKLSLLHNALEKANSKLTPAKLFADQIANPTKASIQNLEDRFASLKVVDAVKSAPIASSPAVVNPISANTASTLSNLYSSPKPRSVPYRLNDKAWVYPKYLRVVNEQGEVVSERKITCPAFRLFTFKDAEYTAEQNDLALTRCIYDILAATPSGSVYSQTLGATYKTFASYWIRRAKMEEHFGNYDEVVNVFDEAERIGAEPIDELKEALRSFVLRMNITGKEIKKQQKRKPGRFDYEELMASVMSPEPVKPTFTAPPHTLTEVADSSPDSQTKNDSQAELDYFDYDGGAVEETEEYADNEQQKSSHELGDLLSQMETLSLRRDLDSPTPANAAKEDAKGTFMAVTPIRARKKEREEYGAETVLTPVRRSARNTPKWVDVSPETENEKKVKQVLKEVGLPFVPNKALQTKTPSKIKKEVATPGSTAKGRSAKSVIVSEKSVSPATHLNLVLENQVHEGTKTEDVVKVSTQDEALSKTEMPVSAATNALVQAPVHFDSTSRTATPTQSTQNFGTDTSDTVSVLTPEQPAVTKSEIPSHLLNPTTPFTHSEEEYDDDQYEGASVEIESPAPSNFFAKNVTPQPMLSKPRQLSLSQSTSKSFPSPFTSGPAVSTSPSRAAPSSILRSKHIAQRVPNSALKREVRFDEYSESPVPLSPQTKVMKTPKVDALKLVSMKPTEKEQQMGTPQSRATPASFVTLRNTPTIKGTPKMGTPRRAARYMGTPGRVLVDGVKEEEPKRQVGTPKRK